MPLCRSKPAYGNGAGLAVIPGVPVFIFVHEFTIITLVILRSFRIVSGSLSISVHS